MSKDKPKKKKVVVSTNKINTTKTTKSGTSRSRSRTSSRAQKPAELLFGRKNFILMGAGLLLIIIGLLLMSGGHMPSPDVWDEDIIYGFRRTVLAPLVILAGLVVEIFAIFKK